jgi:hypothetical protein
MLTPAVSIIAASVVHGPQVFPTAHGVFSALAAGVPAPPVDLPPISPKLLRLMSPSAARVYQALPLALASGAIPPAQAAQAACYLAVGSSGASLPDLTALLAGSLDDRGAFSLAAFAERGLASAHPLLAFALMNNFTLCHAAIAAGLTGESSAYFARGSDALWAVSRAVQSIVDADTVLALTGGADAATHPVTLAELARLDLAAAVTPTDAAALLLLAPLGSLSPPSITLSWPLLLPCDADLDSPVASLLPHQARLRARAPASALAAVFAQLAAPPTAVLLTAALPACAQRLLAALATQAPGIPCHVLSHAGETMAAGPALAIVAACDFLAQHTPLASPASVLVLSLGLDGPLGAVVLSRTP